MSIGVEHAGRAADGGRRAAGGGRLRRTRRQGRDATCHFTVAAGSAKETQSNLLCAEAWGYVSADDIAPALRHLDRELGLLWGLTHPR